MKGRLVPNGVSDTGARHLQRDGDMNKSTNDESDTNGGGHSSVLHRSLHTNPKKVVKAEGLILTLEDGQEIIDATGGAAVACLGHGNQEVKKAILDQMDVVSYCHSLFYATNVAEELAQSLVDSTDGQMARAFIVSSGSEAMEAAVKMARQYFLELKPSQPQRVNFIARKQSYHGTTLGSLAIGGHVARRELYEPLLSKNVSHVSPCYAYRGLKEGESTAAYVNRLADELDAEFQRVGPDSVCAFVAEPVVGAALGCVPAVPGYFKAMKDVCNKYGALLILDEVMSGMGRCGTLHAWQKEGICGDIQTIGKGLGGGYAPVAGMLVAHRVINVLDHGTGAFSHGQTYQGHPIACAAALAVNKIIRQPDMMRRVQLLGSHLERLLRERLEHLPNIGDIRGSGLFWGIELVKDKSTKEPFDPKLLVASGIHDLGMQEPYNISIYPGTGTVDGKRGDHVLLAPPYTSTQAEIDYVAKRTANVIEHFFDQMKASASHEEENMNGSAVHVSGLEAESIVEKLEATGNASSLAPTG